MNDISPHQIIEQIRSLQRELPSSSGNPSVAPDRPGFVDVLKNTIDAVNEVQQAAGEKKREFEAGVGEADLAEVMIAVNKADLSFRAMTEVRNKLVNAYQEIMNMPV